MAFVERSPPPNPFLTADEALAVIAPARRDEIAEALLAAWPN